MLNNISIIALLASAWKLLGGPITLMVISKYLSDNELGIYFTFIAVAAIQQVFEMGISVALVQRYASRNTQLNENKTLFQTSLFVYLILSVIFLISAYIYGMVVFGKKFDVLSSVWVSYIIIIALSLLLNPFYSFIEGSGLVYKTYKAKLLGSIVNYTSLCLCVYYGCGIYSLLYSQLLGLVVQFACCNCYRVYAENRINIKKSTVKMELYSIAGFQTKLTIIWITGYFYWNSYNILIYKYISTEMAGKFGLSFSVMNAISILAQTLMIVRRVEISRLVSQNEYNKAKRIFFLVNTISCLLYSVGAMLLIFILYKFSGFYFSLKLLNVFLLAKLLATGFLMMFIGNVATYCRTSGNEYLFSLSLAMNIITPLAAWYILMKFGSIDYLVNGIFSLHIIYVLISLLMLKGFRREFGY